MSTSERICVGCQAIEEDARLDRCGICSRWFCSDCAFRSTGRRFCSSECARAYFWGDEDDHEDLHIDD